MRLLLGITAATPQERDTLVCFYGSPGSRQFKVMVRFKQWKYIFMANGGREQLFHLQDDPNELMNIASNQTEMKQQLYNVALTACQRPELKTVLDGDDLRKLPFQARPLQRIYQFDASRGITGFPNKPEDVLRHWSSGHALAGAEG
jgi:arylsulfatase